MKQTDLKTRWGRIVGMKTSAPTGLFGSHYTFSDMIAGKSLSSDVLLISVHTSMAGGPTPALPQPAMKKKTPTD